MAFLMDTASSAQQYGGGGGGRSYWGNIGIMETKMETTLFFIWVLYWGYVILGISWAAAMHRLSPTTLKSSALSQNLPTPPCEKGAQEFLVQLLAIAEPQGRQRGKYTGNMRRSAQDKLEANRPYISLPCPEIWEKVYPQLLDGGSVHQQPAPAWRTSVIVMIPTSQRKASWVLAGVHGKVLTMQVPNEG